jgi:hypothetical protein
MDEVPKDGSAMRNDGIDQAKQILWTRFLADTENTFDASVQILNASNAHEWVPVRKPLTVAEAADWIQETKAKFPDAQYDFAPSNPEMRRNALASELQKELNARGLHLEPLQLG